MNILDRIKEDHVELRELLGKIKATTDKEGERRLILFRRFSDLLNAHSKSEEAVLYQRLKKNEDARPKILEGYEEHFLADHLMEQLTQLDVANERWTAKFEVLRESLEHHLDEEERDIFLEARQQIPHAELDEMGLRMTAMKRGIEQELASNDAA